MSITFFFEGDQRRVAERYDCHWCRPESPNPECSECKGNGVIEFWRDDHEFTLSNANGCHLQWLLGLEEDYSGTIDPRQVLDAPAINLLGVYNWRRDVYDALSRLAQAARDAGKQITFG